MWGRTASIAATVLASTAASGTALAISPELVEAARREGRVVWVTSQIMSELALPIAAAFKSAYGIDVVVSRLAPRQIADRLQQGERSGQPSFDVVDGRSTIGQLKRLGLTQPLTIENAAALPAALLDPDRVWFATNVFTLSAVVNTNLVAEAMRPRRLEDLLKPAWSGRIGWSTLPAISSGAGFIGVLQKDLGPARSLAFLEQLQRQQISGFEVSSREIVEKVIAGELAIGLQVYAHQAVTGSLRASPVRWAPVAPVTRTVHAVSVAKRAAHPNAARLLVEFQLSRQGQELFRDAGHVPARLDVRAADRSSQENGEDARAVHLSPEEIEANLPVWNTQRERLFP